MSKRILYLAACACIALLESSAFAQVQMDMWSGWADNKGAYTPHRNDCSNSTEVFVPVAGSNKGLCMDKTWRSAATWDDAREVCAVDDMRLPEPMEFKFACKNPPSGLINMTAGLQWASNQPMWILNGGYVIAAALMGNGSCAYGDWAYVATSGSVESTYPFRCVR